MLKHSLLKITSIIPLVIFALIFIVSMAKASQSENDATSNDPITVNEAINDSEHNDEGKDIVQERVDAKASSPSPGLFLFLNDHLQWFFSVEKPDFINDPYENEDYDNYRATFGFQFPLAE